MEELLFKRKKELETLLGKELKEIKKSTKFLKLIRNELVYLNDFFTKVEILELVNSVFETKVKYSNFYKWYVKNIIKNEIIVPKNNTKKEDITSKNQIDKSEVKNDFANSQVQLAQVKELKDDGELKIADKSDFK
ncbi:hypothetical protein [Arcobacter defluvii]|uniref:Uncharacterized protein n=1 Tax=Arcobacter defluvii TaxID=873191 RepID=A0AAE7BGF5_9BACT|nr:hypothetical protein [Arcobacter defluvii]QKF77476.1 hypothetical protein ADFLV_1451 [Arcobacter defluvii]RXI32066.1 hypothetical protein CP964_08785 [Arcobacter defluvii]